MRAGRRRWGSCASDHSDRAIGGQCRKADAHTVHEDSDIGVATRLPYHSADWCRVRAEQIENPRQAGAACYRTEARKDWSMAAGRAILAIRERVAGDKEERAARRDATGNAAATRRRALGRSSDVGLTRDGQEGGGCGLPMISEPAMPSDASARPEQRVAGVEVGASERQEPTMPCASGSSPSVLYVAFLATAAPRQTAWGEDATTRFQEEANGRSAFPRPGRHERVGMECHMNRMRDSTGIGLVLSVAYVLLAGPIDPLLAAPGSAGRDGADGRRPR